MPLGEDSNSISIEMTGS